MERLLPEVGAAGGYPVDLFVQTAVAAAERPGQARADLFAPGGAELGDEHTAGWVVVHRLRPPAAGLTARASRRPRSRFRR
jgi:hypothetical protein